MSIDQSPVDQRWLSDLRASLNEEFVTQTARLRELTELNADTGDPGEAHNQAALLHTIRNNITQISAALRRIDDGTYGECEKCGKPIPTPRLEALPHARFCVPCQEKHRG